MFISGTHLPRRTMLKGLGVSLALPMLDAMLPAGAAAQTRAAAQRKVRLIAIEMVHGSAGSTAWGITQNLWAPASTGRDFDLGPTSLKTLEPFRDHLTIVSNTDVRNAEAFTLPEIGGDHFRSSAVFLTQMHPKQTQGSDVHVGTSLDQMFAQRFGQETAIPSMQLCIENVDQSGGCSYGYSCTYTDSLSWASPEQPLPMVRDPRVVFDSLFGVGATPGERRQRRLEDKSLLDWLTASVGQLKRDLGAGDRARLDAYLAEVREVERRIQRVEATNSTGDVRELPGAPIGVPDSFSEHVKIMFDLQALAFASDVTRVFAFKLGRDASNRTYSESGFGGAFHSTSHHGERESTIRDFATINTYHVSMVPYLLEKLQKTQDGDATLLDNTLVIYGSPMGDSHVHNHKRCPLFFAGHAGGRLKGGVHVATPDATPMANAMLSAVHTLGMDDVTSFGDSTAALDIVGHTDHDSGEGIAMTSRTWSPFLVALAVAGLAATAAVSAAPSDATALRLTGGQSAQGGTERSRSAVADAASRGDAKAVTALLAQGADVNTAQGDGMTALHWAAMQGSAELSELLLRAGAHPNVATRVGAYTPLLLAARQGHGAVVEALLNAGANPSAKTDNGTTALMFAAQSGDVRSVERLLDRKVDPDARETTRGLTAAMFAAAENRADVIRLLGQRGADLALASDALDLRVIDRSRFNGVLFGNPTQPRPGQQAGSVEGGGGRNAGRGGGPMGLPTENRSRIAGIDRDFSGNELVRTQGGMTPLLFAARQGHVEAAKALLDAGTDLNRVKDGDLTSPLLLATINGHYDLAKVLLERGANPNLASLNGVTPLYAVLNLQWTARAGRPRLQAHRDQQLTYLEMLTLLLDKGADPNTRLATRVWYSGGLSGVDETGSTAFWRAAYASDIDAMKLLAARGADPHLPTVKTASRPMTDDGQREYTDMSGRPSVPTGGPGVPPLVAASGVGYGEGFAANTHHYAPTGMLAAVKYLVEAVGADVNGADHEGNTALHNAAARGDVEMITYLIGKGADLAAINREGKSVADMANGPVQRIQPWHEALALLEKLGAVNHHRCVSC